MPITDGFIDAAQRDPHKPAVYFGNECWSYGDLLRSAQQVASGVQHLAPRDRDQPWIGLLLANRIEFLEVFLGTAIAGGAVMVLSPEWAALQLCQILRKWTPDLLVVEDWCLPSLQSTVAELKDLKIVVVPSVNAPSGVDIGTNIRANIADDRSLTTTSESDTKESYPDWRDRQSLNPQIPQLSEDFPFYLCFTSGTTGHPKGVRRHHRSWINSFAVSQKEFGTTASDRVLAPGSLAHSLFLYTAIEHLAIGATTVLQKKFSPRSAIAQLHDRSITRLVLVPALFSAMIKTALSMQRQFPSVRQIISGGAKLGAHLHPKIPDVFPKATCFEYYGASELSFVSLWSGVEQPPVESVGRAFQGVEISIQREDGSGAANSGEIGWVSVKSELLSLGYLDPNDRIGYRFLNGWATVGDRGWQDEKGYLYLAGREQDLINSGGLKVYPSEVESALCRLPEIADAVVVGIPDADRGDRVCAVLVWSGAAHLSRIELQQYLRTQVAKHKCPYRFFAAPQLPLTASGKVARAGVRQLVIDGDPSLWVIV